MKKLFCAMLAALLMLSLAACDALMPAKQLEGTWKTKTEEFREYTLALLENFDFYEERCSHESSLSPSIHSIMAAEIGNNYAVRVATSDGLVQLSSLRSGVLRMSARELQTEVEATRKEMQSYF